MVEQWYLRVEVSTQGRLCDMARQKITLRDEVRDVLLTLLRDNDVSAIARASAARQLMEMEREDDEQRGTSDIEAMSAEEIDAEIAAHEKKR